MLLVEKLLGSSSAAVAANYIEDVFSTYLYTGNGYISPNLTQSINNSIDLSTYGGMVWIKCRSTAYNNAIFDTSRGSPKKLVSNSTASQFNDTGSLTSFNSNGFSLGSDSGTSTVNAGGQTYTSWTFRKQAKFFDVVTYTGDGTGGSRQVSHNLGSTPGCVLIKRTDASGNWMGFHRGNGGVNQAYAELSINLTTAPPSGAAFPQSIVTSTYFVPGDIQDAAGTVSANVNGATYVAYLFAHNAGGFGAAGTDNVISCGSYTGTGAAGNAVTLGYEPQWLLIKRSDAAQDWFLFDNMRGIVTGSGGDLYLNPNLSAAEGASGTYVAANATGFTLEGTTTGFNASGGTYIYIAIRRGPMKTPTSGTSVFSPITATDTQGQGTVKTTNFPIDFQIPKATVGGGNTWVVDRLRGISSNTTDSANTLIANATDAESSANAITRSWGNTGFQISGAIGNSAFIYWNFRRAPGFFDVVCYTGTAVARTVSHNLGVAPELMIVKSRSVGGTNYDWWTYVSALGNTKAIAVNSTNSSQTAGIWNNTTPTASVFSVDGSYLVNGSGTTYVAYLFATVAGVSKVFSYTGNGSNQTINCGFTGGARFVLIKRTDSTGDWYVWDSARGIVAANDPHLSLNSAAAEVTTDDSVDTDSSGFIVNQLAATNINVNAATYIGLAIA